MLGVKIKNRIINLDMVSSVELKDNQIRVYYNENWLSFCFDNTDEVKQLFEKIEKLTCENKLN